MNEDIHISAKFVSVTQIAKQADVCHMTVRRALEECKISPDALISIGDERVISAFVPGRAGMIAHILGSKMTPAEKDHDLRNLVAPPLGHTFFQIPENPSANVQ